MYHNKNISRQYINLYKHYWSGKQDLSFKSKRKEIPNTSIYKSRYPINPIIYDLYVSEKKVLIEKNILV